MRRCQTLRTLDHARLVGDEWRPPAGCTVERPTYFFPHTSQWPLDIIMGQIFLWASFIAIVVTFVLTVFTKKIFDDKNPYEQGVDPLQAVAHHHRHRLLVIIGFSSIYLTAITSLRT